MGRIDSPEGLSTRAPPVRGVYRKMESRSALAPLNLPHHILHHPRRGLLQRPDSPVPGWFAPCCPRGSGHPYGVHDILKLGQLYPPL